MLPGVIPAVDFFFVLCLFNGDSEVHVCVWVCCVLLIQGTDRNVCYAVVWCYSKLGCRI